VSERNNISELFNIRLFSICSYPTRHANGWLDSAARQHRRHPDFSAYTFESRGCSDSEVFRLTFYSFEFSLLWPVCACHFQLDLCKGWFEGHLGI
jgi:hypothetical protein